MSLPETRDSLVLRIKDADNQAAWEEFVCLYRPAIKRIALSCDLQEADAEEIAQHVLMAVASSVDRYQKVGGSVRFRHWLRRIARNAIINAITRRPEDRGTGRSSVQDLLAQAPSPGEQLDALLSIESRRELYLRASQIVKGDVSEDTWLAFEMTAVRGIEIEKVAEQLGKSVGSIYAARSRVMKRLRIEVAELDRLGASS